MESYATPIPQELYQTTGLATFMVGFFLLAYFFMYSVNYSATNRRIRVRIVHWPSRSYWPFSLLSPLESHSSCLGWVLECTCESLMILHCIYAFC